MKMLLKILICILVFESCCLAIGKQNGKSLNQPFKHFKLVRTNMSAVTDVIEVTRTPSGAHLEYYHEFMGSDKKMMIRTLDGDSRLLAKIDSIWNESGAASWDGFNGPNPPDILDGDGFSFHAELVDGSKIYAHGSNNYPSNFRVLDQGLFQVASYSVIEDTVFKGKYVLIKVPESWKGLVEVAHGYDGYSFSIPNKGGDLYFMRIAFTSECRQDEKTICLGKIKGTDVYVQWYSYGYRYFQKDLDEKKWKAYSDFEQNKNAMMESIVGTDGYKFEAL